MLLQNIFLFYGWVVFQCVRVCVCVCVCARAYHIFFMYLSVDGHLGCFYILATVLSLSTIQYWAACIFFELAFSFLWYIPKTWMAGSYGRLIFSLSEKSPNYFPQWLHQLTFPPTVSPQPHQRLLSVSFLTMAILTGERYLILTGVVFLWIYLITDDAEHLCIRLLAICMCMSSLEKCLFRTSVHF